MPSKHIASSLPFPNIFKTWPYSKKRRWLRRGILLWGNFEITRKTNLLSPTLAIFLEHEFAFLWFVFILSPSSVFTSLSWRKTTQLEGSTPYHMVTELFLVQTFVLRHPVLNLTLFLLQDLLPRYRKMASNESVVFMVSGISDEDRMTEEIFLLCNVRIILGDTRKSFYYPWCSWVWGVTSYFCPANSWTEVKRENDGGGGDKKNAERKKKNIGGCDGVHVKDQRIIIFIFLYIMFYSNGYQGRRRFMLLPKTKIRTLF